MFYLSQRRETIRCYTRITFHAQSTSSSLRRHWSRGLMLDYLLFLTPSLRIMFLINKSPSHTLLSLANARRGMEVTRVGDETKNGTSAQMTARSKPRSIWAGCKGNTRQVTEETDIAFWQNECGKSVCFIAIWRLQMWKHLLTGGFSFIYSGLSPAVWTIHHLVSVVFRLRSESNCI